MPAFPRLLRAAALLLIGILPYPALAQISVPIDGERAESANAVIVAALARPVSFAFPEEPLKDAIDTIGFKTGVPIRIATKKLEEAAINLETPVTIAMHNVKLESFLRNMLGDLGLTYIVRDEALLITTPEDAGSQLETRIYPVLDLVARRVPSIGKSGPDYEALIDTITTTIDPDSWDDVGGAGSVSEFDNAGSIIISQTQDVHKKDCHAPRVSAAREGAAGAPVDFASGADQCRIEVLTGPSRGTGPLREDRSERAAANLRAGESLATAASSPGVEPPREARRSGLWL